MAAAGALLGSLKPRVMLLLAGVGGLAAGAVGWFIYVRRHFIYVRRHRPGRPAGARPASPPPPPRR
jgi:hypothetical protein